MKKIFLVVLAVATAAGLAACTTYERQVVPFKMPSAYPNATSVADATIAAKAFDDKDGAAAAFGFDIRGAGILPVQVIFDNTGSHPLEIVTDKTLLVDEENNLWPILDERMAYDRLSQKTELGRVMPEAAKGGLLAGAAGAVIGAAVGIVTGQNVAAAAGKGAAVGAAAGGHRRRGQGVCRLGCPPADPGGSPEPFPGKARRGPQGGGPRFHILPWRG